MLTTSRPSSGVPRRSHGAAGIPRARGRRLHLLDTKRPSAAAKNGELARVVQAQRASPSSPRTARCSAWSPGIEGHCGVGLFRCPTLRAITYENPRFDPEGCFTLGPRDGSPFDAGTRDAAFRTSARGAPRFPISEPATPRPGAEIRAPGKISHPVSRAGRGVSAPPGLSTRRLTERRARPHAASSLG